MNNRISFQYLLLTAIIVFSIIACKKEPNTPNNNNQTNPQKDTTLFNVTYGSHGRQVYDIYLPALRDTTTPVILMIHGGAWKAGQKEDFNNYLNVLKSKWTDAAIVNMNYRLASNANNIHHDEIMADIDDVVDHLNSNKSNYYMSNKIAIMGASAGAQLAMIYAYKYNSDIKCVGSIFGPTIINDWSWYNSTNLFLGAKIGDILTEYVGQSWDTTAYSAVSPYWNIDSSSQATIIFHGNLDPIVPFYHSQWMHSKLNTLGVTNEFHQYTAFHSFDATQSDDVLNKMVAFFKTHLKE
jgi:acetyl esterase/lipase